MLILSRVCAEFHDKNGAVIHRITPAMIGLFHDAPEAIRGDLLFDMLLQDGSIKTPEDARKDRNLERDPMGGATADGKEKASEKEPEPAAKTAKGTKAAKAETKADIRAETKLAEEKPAEAEQKK